MQITKTRSRCTIWFMTSQKKYHKVHASSLWSLTHALKASTNKRRIQKKVVCQNCQNIWTCIYLQKQGASKHSRKKIIQLLWTVVTCLLKNVEHKFEHDIDSAYGVPMH